MTGFAPPVRAFAWQNEASGRQMRAKKLRGQAHGRKMLQQRRQVITMKHLIFRYLHTLAVGTALAALVAVSPQMLAQTTASLSGTVQDSTGAVIADAHVTLTNIATNEVRTLDSNSSGYFSFAGILPGTYKVNITAKGFRGIEQSDIMVNPGDTRTLKSLVLEAGSATESITVQSSANYVAPEDSGERSALLTSRDIERLPLASRNASELLKILPGVTTTASGTGNGPGFDFTDAGSSGSTVGVGLNTNGAPYRGGTAYLLDGASIIDPGCACWSIATVNPDMTQEVKVQSSNFGADSPQGPVVINVISRSGSAQFHGQAYLYVRNAIFNANSWQNKHSNNPTRRPDAAYYYPGGSIGGPILIPHTDFNHNRKLLFWAGFEAFRQTLPASSPLTSYVPTSAMRNGNFSLSDPANAALCAQSTGSGDFCQSLTGGFAPDGTPLSGYQIPSQYLDPGALALLKLFPAANTDPSTNGSGYNYYLQTTSQHNGYIYRGRVDYNLSDRNKIFVSYQYGTDTSTTPAHIYYTPSNSIAYPGGNLISPVHSHVLSGSFIHIFNASATNELRISRGWLDNPYTASDLDAITKSAVGYPMARCTTALQTLFPRSIRQAPVRSLRFHSQTSFSRMAPITPSRHRRPCRTTSPWSTKRTRSKLADTGARQATSRVAPAMRTASSPLAVVNRSTREIRITSSAPTTRLLIF